MELLISNIKIKNQRRPVDVKKVRELADSIKNIGLLNPITVTQDYTLVAGLHRIEAYQQLGRVKIEAHIISLDALHAKLAEIDENLMRNELHFTEIGELAIQRDELLLALGARATVGQGRPKNGAKFAPLKTTADIAKDMGVSKRTLQENKQMAKNLTPEVKEAIVENDIPKSEAIKVARLEPEEQMPKVVAFADARKIAAENATQRDLHQISRDYDALEKLNNAITNSKLFSILSQEDEFFLSVIAASNDFPGAIRDIDRYITALSTIKSRLILLKGGRHE